MGINNFNKWLYENYRQIYTFLSTSDPKHYDNIYIDLNPLLHSVVRTSRKYSDIYEKLQWHITHILKHVRPDKRIIFATDGIPSFAKMILQRERRIVMARCIAESDLKQPFINPIILTACSQFMNELYGNIKHIFNKLQNNYNNVQIISLIDIIHGESEFKLMDFMKQNTSPSETNIFVSNDADIVVMCTQHKNMYVLTEIKKKYVEINIDKLVLNKNCSDMCLIFLLCGNDYLPRLGCYKLTLFLEHYLKRRKQLTWTENNQIYINNKNLSDILFAVYGKCNKTKLNLYDFKFNKIINYIDGLTWCLNDYSIGHTSNISFMYKYKKNVVNPLLLAIYLSYNRNKIFQYPTNNSDINIDSQYYTSLVIPYKLSFLTNKKYTDFIDNNYKQYYEHDKCNVCVDMHNKLSALYCSFNYTTSVTPKSEMCDKLKKQINEKAKELQSHKKIHKTISRNKYIEIIKSLNNFVNQIQK